MQVILGALVVTVLGGFMLILGSLIGTIFGMIGGYAVQIFFGDIIAAGFHQLGFAQVSSSGIWQIGGLLGFVSGFVRSNVSTTSKS